MPTIGYMHTVQRMHMMMSAEKPEKNKNRICIVGEYKNNELKMAISVCSGKDQYIKKIGRNIAIGRLNKNKIFKKITLPVCSSKQFIEISLKLVDEKTVHMYFNR
jgi:hypothetical protein